MPGNRYQIRIRASAGFAVPQLRDVWRMGIGMAVIQAKELLAHARQSPHLGIKYDTWEVFEFEGSGRYERPTYAGRVDA